MNSNTRPTSQSTQAWHPADIKAALEKAGYSFVRIAAEHGYSPNAPSKVLFRPWSQVQEIIGEILGVSPAKIWPDRYEGGLPKGARAARLNARTRLKNNHTTTKECAQ